MVQDLEERPDNQLYDLFLRFCDQTRDQWEEPVRALGLDPAMESELVELLLSQSQPCPALDSTAMESFPHLARSEPITVDGFEIIRQLGSGGMGIVYLAEELELGRYVALKMLPSVLTLSPNAVQRFKHEARSAAALDHPNIVKVYRFGRWQDTHYIASKYIEGDTLAQLIERVKARGGDRRWMHTALEIVRLIALALEHAHQNSVTHRDVKPSNILIDTNGAAHLADFGVAKTTTSIELTLTKETPGTLGYMSPEQAGLITAPVGPVSDVYSLGAVLYECMTLERLHPGDSSFTVLNRMDKQHRLRVHSRGMKLSADCRMVCLKALEWDPKHRYASAGDLAADLDRVIRGAPIRARKQPAHRRLAALMRRKRNQVVIAGALLLAALGITVPMLIPDAPPPGRLIVRSTAPGSQVSHQLYDTESQTFGPEIVLGDGAVNERLTPGHYRILVRTDAGLAEFSRDILPDRTYEIDASPAPVTQTTEGMILIPGGPAIVGGVGSRSVTLGGRTVELRPFWIDRTEVTNAQYRAFVLATGATPPRLWEDPYNPAMDPLPVSAVTFLEARRYTEWAGKRLPTAWEWERAARGTDGRRYPWGDDFFAVDDPGNIGVASQRGLNGWSSDYENPELRLSVMANLRPASVQSGADISPDGGLHFFGNVAEYTDSPFVQFNLVDAPFSSGQYLIKGKHWNGEADGSYKIGSIIPMGQNRAIVGAGFRCARSVHRGDTVE